MKENREAPPPSENPQPSTSPKKGRHDDSSSSESDEAIQDQITNPIDGPSQQHEDFLQIEGEESISVLPIELNNHLADRRSFGTNGEIFLKRTATGALIRGEFQRNMNQMNLRATLAKKDSGDHLAEPASGAHIADSKRNLLQLEQPRGKEMKDGGVTSSALLK